MTETRDSMAAEEAAALLLQGQALLGPPDRRPTRKSVLRTVHQLGYVQVDSINVVARAHDLILRARFRNYRPEHLRRLLEDDRSLFENWTHDAAVIPTEWAPAWRHRFVQYRSLRRERMARHSGARSFGALCGQVRRRIAREGPLASSDFESPASGNGGWWQWKPAKVALEYLWRTGGLVVASRERFQKRYDLTERFLPALAEARAMRRSGYVTWACREALDRLSTATPRELADFFGLMSAGEATAWCRAALARGEAVPVTQLSSDGTRSRPGVAVPDWRERLDRVPAAPRGVRCLSPFDPVLRDRARLEHHFGFAYRFEAFVPAAKRRDGYYVMPLWRGTRPIGRFDPKLERETGTLHVRRLRLEPDVQATRALVAEIDDALDELRVWLGAERVARTS